MRVTLHAHTTRGRPGPGRLLLDLADVITATGRAVLAIGEAVEDIDAGLQSQLNVLSQILTEAQSRAAPWERPLATRVARGRG